VEANIIKELYWENLTIMKKILSLYEYKAGRDSEEYLFFKKEVMEYFYGELNKFYKNLEKQGEVEKCSCKANLRQGYRPCDDCGGSGYRKKK